MIEFQSSNCRLMSWFISSILCCSCCVRTGISRVKSAFSASAFHEPAHDRDVSLCRFQVQEWEWALLEDDHVLEELGHPDYRCSWVHRSRVLFLSLFLFLLLSLFLFLLQQKHDVGFSTGLSETHHISNQSPQYLPNNAARKCLFINYVTVVSTETIQIDNNLQFLYVKLHYKYIKIGQKHAST